MPPGTCFMAFVTYKPHIFNVIQTSTLKNDKKNMKKYEDLSIKKKGHACLAKKFI